MKTFTILLFTTALNGTAFAQSLQVAPNGNVGIGTTTPSAKLTVTNGDDARLNLFSNGGSISVINSVANSDGNVGRWLSINPTGGNVGIGTYTPMSGFGLDVASHESRIAANGLYFKGSGINPSDGLPWARLIESYGMRFNSPNPAWVLSTSGSLLAGYQPDGRDWGWGNAYISGNVGVGTVTPNAKLDVLKSSPSDGSFAFPNGEWAARILNRVDHPSQNGLIVANRWKNSQSTAFAVGSMFDFGQGFTIFFKIDGDGNVGIGTTNLSHKLTVNGQVKSRGYITDTSAWADYVFAPDYKLPSLNEVEAHIKSKGHLPDVPSEAELVSNGLDLGKMSATQMAQIEQLMLHVIALNKQVQAQAEQVSFQAEEIRKLKSQAGRN